jgi:mono/diheme cytochrome c family protein
MLNIQQKEFQPMRTKAFVYGLALIAGLSLFAACTALAQQIKHPWVAPVSASSMKNPVKSSPAGDADAGKLFQQNCVICHGQTGASNGPAAGSLPQKPANFTDVAMMKKATDGELFWKMTTGRAPMPSWQDRLTETQRWELVNYLRELTKKGQYKYLGIGAPKG